MIDLRPVGFVLGMLSVALAAFMLLPLALDWQSGSDNWRGFLSAASVTGLAGGVLALACANGLRQGLSLRQAFLVTVAVWVGLPAFGALPMMFGAPGLSFTDAMFEAVSGMTTTGTTVIGPDPVTGAPGLDHLPMGTNLWRAMLNWLGGLGIVIVAMIFLPVLRVGGMQFFRSESFDTGGKIMPRAFDISVGLIEAYVGLTVVCALAFNATGMNGFDAVIHALTCVSTGGFSNYDASFATYLGLPQLVAILFMLLAALPFVRYVQMMGGDLTALWRDVQVRAFLRLISYAVLAVVLAGVLIADEAPFYMLREATFNVVTIVTGTGYFSVDVQSWGGFAFVLLISVGLIGGCTASTSCSVKVFRYQILIEAVRQRLRQMGQPHAVHNLRYDGKPVSEDVLDSVIVFFTAFMLSFGLLMVGLSLTGLHLGTALTAAWTAIANVGPVWGPEVRSSGAITDFPTAAKWMMIGGMVLGRLELMSVYVLFFARFWRD